MRSKPAIIPVLDVMNGIVVRAVGGRRNEYCPLESRLTTSTHPQDVAAAMIAATGATAIYVADLDAIRDRGTNLEVIARLTDLGVVVWYDGGFREMMPELPAGVRPILATESLGGPEQAKTMAGQCPRERAASLDSAGGRLLGEWPTWHVAETDLGRMAERLVTATLATTLFAIDLAQVGERAGPAPLTWGRGFKAQHPAVDLIVGGGVRNRDDIQQMTAGGADGILVATVLHDNDRGGWPGS